MDRRDFLKASGWSFLGLAASGTLLSCIDGSSSSKSAPSDMKERCARLKDMKIYWGDIHNHCNLTYGHGDIDDAVEAAKGQLDFVSITPHALWPDIPGENDPRLNWVIDYHVNAFDRLRAGGWDGYVKKMKESNVDGEFLTFTSYECHSMEHGDHVALCHDYDTPLFECTSVPDLMEKLKPYKAFVTPHHMGYMSGFRGYNWAEFKENEQCPFVEMFSRHGLAECDMGDYNYLHDMGPRIFEGSVQYGLEQGNKFGLMCSTDQHAGYPGSYGDGRIGILCDGLDKDKLWDGMSKRHMCGVTGDKIKIDFSINGATMGDVISARNREIFVNVEGQNFIDYVDLIKNGQCIARLSAPFTVPISSDDTIRAKVKIDFGWNREEEYIHWLGNLRITDGEILDVQPCFRGAAFTAPQPGEHQFKVRPNRITGQDKRSVELDMYSTKNPNVLTAAQQGVILDVEMSKGGRIIADFNGQEISYTLEELLIGARAHFMRGWLSEAIQFNRAAPEQAFSICHFMEDDNAERDTDYYYVRVRQRDGQWAWSSPIWVEKA